jgi:hypothetical protein
MERAVPELPAGVTPGAGVPVGTTVVPPCPLQTTSPKQQHRSTEAYVALSCAYRMYAEAVH